MKKAKFFGLALLVSGICLLSCTKEDGPQSDQVQAQIESSLESGAWRISLFEDSGDDETGHFSGYNFTFGSDGILTADNGMIQYKGSWSISDSNSDDDSMDDLHFNISFDVSNDFEELNEDWSIISQAGSKIELIHISGGNGGTDYLTFERN